MLDCVMSLLKLSVVKAPVVGVVAPTVPLILIDAVPLNVPPSVRLPDVVTVPVRVKPLTVPVPETLETVAPVELFEASNVTVPELFFAYSFMSAMLSANSPATKLPAEGVAEAVVL